MPESYSFPVILSQIIRAASTTIVIGAMTSCLRKVTDRASGAV